MGARSGSTSSCQLPSRALTRHEPNSSERAKLTARPAAARDRPGGRCGISGHDDVVITGAASQQAVPDGSPDEPGVGSAERRSRGLQAGAHALSVGVRPPVRR